MVYNVSYIAVYAGITFNKLIPIVVVIFHVIFFGLAVLLVRVGSFLQPDVAFFQRS